MKLRNKKTGEIIETDYMFGVSIPTTETFGCKSYDQIAAYSSLAELNEEWEDAPDTLPDTYYLIDGIGGVNKMNTDWELAYKPKEIGNYFETKEEAEKAVEKLKAWKRLKDKGFRFKTWGWENEKDNEYVIWFELNDKEGDCSDLDLLFGGEE